MKKLSIALLALALAACGGGSDLAIGQEGLETPGTAVISDYLIDGDDITVAWDKTEGADADNWRLYLNRLRMCEDDLSPSSNNQQSGSCSFSLVDGTNSIYVQLCNYASDGSSLCSASDIQELEHILTDSGNLPPGDIYLESLPTTTSDQQLYVEWVKEQGVNGDLWYIYHNNRSVCSGSLPFSAEQQAQSAGCTIALDVGEHQFQASLCVDKPVGLDDICTFSEVRSLSSYFDPALELATPVLDELDASLPAWSTEINWSKNTQDGSAGESWTFYHNNGIACTGVLAADEHSSSCTLELQEGSNSMYVQLCTDVATYSGASCSESEYVEVEGIDPYAVEPGAISITSAIISATYEEILTVDWEISSGTGVKEWYVQFNDSEQCRTTSSDYLGNGSCPVELVLGENTISVIGCNYGMDGGSLCSQSDAKTTELLELPGKPEITSPTADTTHTTSQTLSWVRTTGLSAERWHASNNGADVCWEDLSAADQSAQCEIDLQSGNNELQVRLCANDSVGVSYCSYSDVHTIELLAPIPGQAVISTESQIVYTDTITIDWTNTGTAASSWSLTNNGSEVEQCGPAIQSSGSTQSGSCSVSLSFGANLIAVTLCNTNAIGSQSCSTSDSVSLDLEIDSPEFTSSSAISVDEHSTGVIYTPDVQDNDSSSEQISFALLSVDDYAAFALDTSSGAITPLIDLDYENPQDSDQNNIYQLQLEVYDETDSSDSLTLQITITNLNDNQPTFANTNPEPITVPENTSADSILYTATATDLDGDTIAYTLGGADSAYFSLDSTSATLSFIESPDFEIAQDQNQDNTYELEISASDADFTTSVNLSVSVTDSNDESPQVPSSEASTAHAISTLTLETLIYTAAATDADADDVLTYTLSGVDADQFSLDSSSGELYFTTLPSFDDPQDNDGDNIYDLEITVSDAAANSTSFALEVTIADDVGKAPEFSVSSPASVDFPENSTALAFDANATDPEADPITYTLGGTDAELFTIDSATGELSFKTAPDYETPLSSTGDNTYLLSLFATDPIGNQSQLDLSVAVTNLNDNQPSFTNTNPDPISVPEATATSTILYTATATDADNDTLNYSLGGADSAHFNLGSATGELSFKQVPDFEDPQDQDQDNNYELEISANDGETSATLELSIEVTDIVDTVPNIPANFSAAAGDSSVVLSWDSLESITNYTIYQSTSSDLSTSNSQETYANLSTSPETISGLSNATTYYFLITASNSFGESLPSAVVSATPQAYTLACPYPSATASKADTSAIDCSCVGSSANALLALTSEVTFSCADSQRSIIGNSVPDHAPGVFPNDGNPNAIAAVTGNYSHSLQPTWFNTEDTSEQVPGVARNGVKLEPETGETYQGDNSWRYEAIQDALDLGLDEHHAHVQPTGMYHYHGMPEGHLDLIGISNSMILVGWARDGHPIYARYGYSDPLDSSSGIKVVSGSYEHRDLDELNSQGRPSSDSERGLDSLPLGVFVADWEYVDGSGDLDECNGRYGVTPQFPDGIYHYYITDDYPYIQRCLKGNEAPSFTSASSVDVPENTIPDSVIYTASAIDSGGDSFTFALNSSAHDSALFSLDSDSGELRFLTSPNFEDPHDGNGNNRYTVVIEADDGLDGGIAPLELEVTVTDVEEYPPYFANTSDIGSVTEDPDTEGQEIAVLALEFDLYDDEDDAVGRALSLELEGEDGGLFALDSTEGTNRHRVNFITSPDFDFAHDIDGDSNYSFTIVATDSDANEVRHSATIVVDGINDEAPYINPEVYDGTAIYIPENDASVIINLTGAGYDPDRTSWSDPNPYQPNQDSITFALTTHMSQSDSDLFYLDPDTLELSPKEPFDFENPQQLNSNDNSYWVEVALSDQAGNKNTIDGSEEGAGDRIVRVTISDIVDESAQPVESGPQIPWFNSSDLAPGADVVIPWVIYAGEGAINWDMYVNGNTECSYVVSDINSPVSSGTCIVSGSKFTTGTTDNSVAVSVCDIDGNCATSENVIFGYAVSSTDGYYPSYPSNSGDASDCADVDIGEPVNSTNNSSCYNYLLSDDAFGGPYNEIPAYLKADSGRNFDVIAYFIEWGVYERDFDTHDLPANLLSTALFSFIKFDGDRVASIDDEDEYRECEDCTFTGEVAIADTWAVFDKPYYKPGEEEKYEDEADDADHLAEILAEKGVSTGKGIFQQLWLLKQKFPHLKTCVSVGGWSFSRPFPLLRTQQGMLETFVDSIIDLAEQYHFDCIDIDWEFPGKAGGDHVDNNSAIVYDLDNDGNTPFINPTDEDADTFNELIAALRTEILSRNLDIEINSAVYTSTDGMAIMDYAAFANDLHGIHMMTYDYYGAWDLFTGMQAALYPSADPVHGDVILREGYNPYNPDHNIASAMTRGVNNAMNKGFASNARIRQKIVPGLAFYGRNYSGVGRNGNPEPSSKRFMVPAERDGNGETKRFGWEAGNLNYIQLKGYYNHGDTVYGNADYITGYDQFGDPYTTGGYHWTYQWSDEAQTPFLFDDNYSVVSGSFISYTDPRAIYYQTCHAAWQNSKGVMFWEISGDSKDFHLVNAIHAAVRGDDLVHDNYTNNPSCTDLDQIDHGNIVYGEAAGSGDGDGDGDGDGGDGDGGDGDNGGDSGEGLAGLVELGYIDSSTFNSMFPHRNNDPSSTASSADTYTWDGLLTAATNFAADGFLNEGSTEDRLRELAAFLANTSHETGNSNGGYELSNIGTGIGNTRYDAGYYFQQEQYCAAGGSGYGYDSCNYCATGNVYDYACEWLYDGGTKFDDFYYGRGPLQLSWNYNYGPFSEYYYNGDADVLLYDPNKMLEDSEVAFASAIWFWMSARDGKPAAHDVMIGNYQAEPANGRYPSFGMTINIINGGLECGAAYTDDSGNKNRNRIGFYLTYLNIFSNKQGSGIAPWVTGNDGTTYGSTPATSLDFPTNVSNFIDPDNYPDADALLSCRNMVHY